MMRICLSATIFCLLLVLCSAGSESSNNNTEIILVHVIFRHGERTTYRFYPTDPHKNETFYPYGLGGLTNNGKLMMFKLGEILRKMYGNFLGEDYEEEKLYVKSTDTSRTKMSALLVLAGLWPPSESQKWHPYLMWQPIPVFVDPFDKEKLLTPDSCKTYSKIIANLQKNSTVVNTYLKPYKDLFKYIELNAGISIRDLMDLIQFYFILKSEDGYGLQLPEWTKSIYPEPLHSVASLVYPYTSLDVNARRIQSGYLLQKILNDSIAKIDSTLSPSGRKMFLYSGHESTVGNFMRALDVFIQEVPPYGSAIIVEVHKLDEQYYIKLKYVRHPFNPSIKHLIIPNCGVLCPIAKFMQLQADNGNLPILTYEETCDVNNIP